MLSLRFPRGQITELTYFAVVEGRTLSAEILRRLANSITAEERKAFESNPGRVTDPVDAQVAFKPLRGRLGYKHAVYCGVYRTAIGWRAAVYADARFINLNLGVFEYVSGAEAAAEAVDAYLRGLREKLGSWDAVLAAKHMGPKLRINFPRDDAEHAANTAAWTVVASERDCLNCGKRISGPPPVNDEDYYCLRCRPALAQVYEDVEDHDAAERVARSIMSPETLAAVEYRERLNAKYVRRPAQPRLCLTCGTRVGRPREFDEFDLYCATCVVNATVVANAAEPAAEPVAFAVNTELVEEPPAEPAFTVGIDTKKSAAFAKAAAELEQLLDKNEET